MIRCLRSVFHLAKSLMRALCSLSDRLCKQFIFHKVGTGTGCQETTVFYQLQSAEIDLTVTLNCVFDGTA